MNFRLGEFTKYELTDSITGEILAEGEVLTSQIEYPEIQEGKLKKLTLHISDEKRIELEDVIINKL